MSESIYPVKPLVFSSSPGSVREEGDEVILPRALMNEWIDQFPPGQPMLAHLACIETEVSRIVCVGCDNEEPFVFAPHWILEQMGLTPDTEAYVSLTPCRDELPSATKITVRFEEHQEDLDLRQLLETHLDMFHVLEEGTVLRIQQEDLYATVVALEPAPRCRLGGEVVLEILEEGLPSVEESPVFPSVVPSVEESPVFPSVVPSTIPSVEASPIFPSVIPSSEEIRQARLRRFATSS
jgi:hypothetical protein